MISFGLFGVIYLFSLLEECNAIRFFGYLFIFFSRGLSSFFIGFVFLSTIFLEVVCCVITRWFSALCYLFLLFFLLIYLLVSFYIGCGF